MTGAIDSGRGFLSGTLRADHITQGGIRFMGDWEAHLERQKAWSLATFGPEPRLSGVIDHLRRELIELEAEPLDLEEWADVILLAMDGAWRAGHAPAEVVAAVKAKQAKNEGRTWPDWRTADPDKAIEHVKG